MYEPLWQVEAGATTMFVMISVTYFKASAPFSYPKIYSAVPYIFCICSKSFNFCSKQVFCWLDDRCVSPFWFFFIYYDVYIHVSRLKQLFICQLLHASCSRSVQLIFLNHKLLSSNETLINNALLNFSVLLHFLPTSLLPNQMNTKSSILYAW